MDNTTDFTAVIRAAYEICAEDVILAADATDYRIHPQFAALRAAIRAMHHELEARDRRIGAIINDANVTLELMGK